MRADSQCVASCPPCLYPLLTPCGPEVPFPGPALGPLFQKGARIGLGDSAGARCCPEGVFRNPLSLDLRLVSGDLGPFNLLKMKVFGNARELLYPVGCGMQRAAEKKLDFWALPFSESPIIYT